MTINFVMIELFMRCKSSVVRAKWWFGISMGVYVVFDLRCVVIRRK